MTTKQIVKILKRYRPAEPAQLDGLLRLLPLGEGCFRSVYAIAESSWIIKFPIHRCDKWHSRREIRAVRALTRKVKFRHLARYCPKMPYADYQHGVIVMEHILEIGIDNDSVEQIITQMFKDTIKNKTNLDLSGTNLGYGSRGQIKIVDFGCVRGNL